MRGNLTRTYVLLKLNTQVPALSLLVQPYTPTYAVIYIPTYVHTRLTDNSRFHESPPKSQSLHSKIQQRLRSIGLPLCSTGLKWLRLALASDTWQTQRPLPPVLCSRPPLLPLPHLRVSLDLIHRATGIYLEGLNRPAGDRRHGDRRVVDFPGPFCSLAMVRGEKHVTHVTT